MTNPEVSQGGHEALLRQQEIFHEKFEASQQLIDQGAVDGTLNEEILGEMVEDLDGACPYLLQPVLISGNALVPVIDQETLRVEGEVWDKVIHQGTYHGVEVIEDEAGKVMLTQVVVIGESTTQSNPTCVETRKYLAYFTNDANITPLLEIESTYNPHYLAPYQGTREESMQGFDIVWEKSAELVNLLRDTKFRRMDRRKQLRALDTIVNEASEAASITEQTVAIEADYAYVLELENDNRLGLNRLRLGRFAISGQCVAVDSLERIALPVRKIKSDKELLDKKAGLCIIIDPDNVTREELELNGSQTIYVPTRSQSVKLSILGDY